MTADPAADLVGPGCADYAAAVPDGPGSVTGMSTDPVAVAASNNPLLTTLVAAVSGQLNPDVNLVDTLNGDEFTVFAPVDDAFAKIDPADHRVAQDRLRDALVDPHVPRGARAAVAGHGRGHADHRPGRHRRGHRLRRLDSWSTAPTSSAAACTPPTRPSTSSTRCSCRRCDDPAGRSPRRPVRLRSPGHRASSGAPSQGTARGLRRVRTRHRAARVARVRARSAVRRHALVSNCRSRRRSARARAATVRAGVRWRRGRPAGPSSAAWSRRPARP